MSNGFLQNYENNLKKKFNCSIQIVNNSGFNCCGATIKLNQRYIIFLNEKLSEKYRTVCFLHEISHIQLGFLGKKYEKKSGNYITERIVNMNMIIRNKNIWPPGKLFQFILLSIFSEKLLYKKIEFKKEFENV